MVNKRIIFLKPRRENRVHTVQLFSRVLIFVLTFVILWVLAKQTKPTHFSENPKKVSLSGQNGNFDYKFIDPKVLTYVFFALDLFFVYFKRLD